MKPVGGAAKILRFNFPLYLGALAAAGAGAAIIAVSPSPLLRASAAAAVSVAGYWAIASLIVSWYVYDRSAVARGVWLDGATASGVVAVLHAGQDEATLQVAARMPGAALRVFDFHQPGKNGTPSLRRARASGTASAAEPIPIEAIPLEAGSLGLGLLVFSAHELRSPAQRAVLFRELARAAGPAGRLRVVEHLRDAWNFLAYGPGAFHFLGRRQWLESFSAGGWRLARERPCTPFVRVFELEPLA